jgi:predicted nucleic acid-binding protein
LLLSEVADYELRRELLRLGSHKSVARLDELTRELRYLPTATATWRTAARLWADLRRSGRVTGDGLDGDLLIAAQALEEVAGVITFNEKHFENVVEARSWASVPLLHS